MNTNMTDMGDKLISLFRNMLDFVLEPWKKNEEIRVEVEEVTGKEPWNYSPNLDINSKDPNQVFVVVRIFFPEFYKKENGDWSCDQAGTLPNRYAVLLYALGLSSVLADSIIDTQRGCFTFWAIKSKELYDHLPTITKPMRPDETLPWKDSM